jgi:hypothetical protein
MEVRPAGDHERREVEALWFERWRSPRLAALHRGAIAQSRTLKPEIPETGLDGIPIRDELELELPVRPSESR